MTTSVRSPALSRRTSSACSSRTGTSRRSPAGALRAEESDAHLVEWVRDRLNPIANPYRRPETARGRSRSRPARWSPTSHGSGSCHARAGIQWPAELGPMLRPFLLGYFDGDGWIYVVRDKYPGWDNCSGSRSLPGGHEGVHPGQRRGHAGEDPPPAEYATCGRWPRPASGRYVLDQWLHQGGHGLARKQCTERARGAVSVNRSRPGRNPAGGPVLI